MRGTEPADQTLLRRLTLAGWLLLGGAASMITFQVSRTRSIGDGSEAFGQSAWDQRLEVLSFVMLPPNIVVLAPAVAVAAIVTVAATDRSDRPWAVALLRTCAGVAAVLFVVGALFLVSLTTRDRRGPFEWDDGHLRIGGMAMAAGMFVVCRAADTATRPRRPGT